MKIIERILLAYVKIVNPSEVVPKMSSGCAADVCWYVPTRSTLPTLANRLYTKVAMVMGSSGDVSHIIRDVDMTRVATTMPVLKVSKM